MLLVVVVVLVIIFWTAHDFKKAGAEVVNEKNIRKYLDHLVNADGFTAKMVDYINNKMAAADDNATDRKSTRLNSSHRL